MEKKYDVYNEYGRKIGYAIEQPDPNAGLACLIIGTLLLGIGWLIAPFWAAYQIGRGTWQYYGCLIRSVTGLALTGWILGLLAYTGLFVVSLLSPDLACDLAQSNETDQLRECPPTYTYALAPATIFILLYVPYKWGESRR
jgi:hypothetical protein